MSAITFISGATGKPITGEPITIPGYEALDLICVQDGFEQKIYELASGLEILATTSFTKEDAVRQALDFLLEKKVTPERILTRIMQGEGGYMGKDSLSKLKRNNSPAYDRFVKKLEDDYNALPDLYSEDEKKEIRRMMALAKLEGVSTYTWEQAIIRKDNGKNKKTTVDTLRDILNRSIVSVNRERLIKDQQPLPDHMQRDHIEISEEWYMDAIQGHLSRSVEPKYLTLPEDLRNRSFAAWKQAAEIHNKYGYWPKWMGDIGLTTNILVVFGTMGARNQGRKEGLPDDIKELEKCIQNINEWHKKEFLYE